MEVTISVRGIYPIKSTILCTRVAASFSSGEAVAKHWSTVASTFNSAVAKGSGNDWFAAPLPVSFSAPFFAVPWDWGTPCVDRHHILFSNTAKNLFFLTRDNYPMIVAFIRGLLSGEAGTHLYTWMERGTVRVKCLAQQHNTMSRSVLEPGPLDSETSALTTRHAPPTSMK